MNQTLLPQRPPRGVGRFLRRPITWIMLTALVVVAAAGLALFQPWKLWVDQTVNEAAPVVRAAPDETEADVSTSAAPAPSVLASGDFISHEHHTTGSVKVIETAGGARYLRLENLDTSNGPTLRVWLSDVTDIEGRSGWRIFDDGSHVDLGELKGNKGSHNYRIPDSVELDRYHSVTIWCARFHVSFGAAALTS
jgi:hypothetical protein